MAWHGKERRHGNSSEIRDVRIPECCSLLTYQDRTSTFWLDDSRTSRRTANEYDNPRFIGQEGDSDDHKR